MNSILVSQAPKETPKVRKFESYNADTYKTDEQKKEEVYTHFFKHFFSNKRKRKDQGLYNSPQRNKAHPQAPTHPSKNPQKTTDNRNKCRYHNCQFSVSLLYMYLLSWKKKPDAFQILMCTVNEAIFSHQCWCKWTLRLNLDNWRSMMTHFIVLSSVAECYDQQIVQTRRPSSPRFSRRGGWRWMGKAINLTK